MRRRLNVSRFVEISASVSESQAADDDLDRIESEDEEEEEEDGAEDLEGADREVAGFLNLFRPSNIDETDATLDETLQRALQRADHRSLRDGGGGGRALETLSSQNQLPDIPDPQVFSVQVKVLPSYFRIDVTPY